MLLKLQWYDNFTPGAQIPPGSRTRLIRPAFLIGAPRALAQSPRQSPRGIHLTIS
jgi:hypothetical protein